MAAGSLPGVGTISDVTSQGAGGSISRDSGAAVAGSTNILNSVAGGGDGGGTNPNTPTSANIGPSAANPNAGGDSQAMTQLVNMRVGASPSLRIAQQDAASRVAAAGLRNTYVPNGGSVTGGGTNPNGNVGQLINDARGWIGVPYEYGGTGRSGVDCSGFTQAVYGQIGMNIGRDTSAQFRSGQVVGADGNWNASVNQLQAGDLIFYGQPGASGPNAHVVMYIGNGQIIQAAHTGTNVAIGPLFNSASSDEPFLGVRRYISSTSSAPGAGNSAGLAALQADTNPGTGRQQFAQLLLQSLGDRPTAANINSLVNWEGREGGNWNNPDTYNPLNTTLGYNGSHGTNGPGVQAYRSWLDGLTATVNTLHNGMYGDILQALASGNGLGGYLKGLGTWSGGGYYSI